MPSYGITIRDAAGPTLRRLAGGLAARDYLPAVGEAGKLVLVNHFAEREGDSSAHKTASDLGARPTGQYAQFARSTNWRESGPGVDLVVSHVAARQRYAGGEIRPVNTKYLTLPANAAAYGRRVREFGGALRPMVRRVNGKLRAVALVADKGAVTVRSRRRKGRVELYGVKVKAGIYYWLVEKVTQGPDPKVLPTDKQLTDGVADALTGWIDDVTGGPGNA